MGQARALSLLCAFLLGESPAPTPAERVVVTPAAGVSGSELDDALRGLGVKQLELGNGKQVWVFAVRERLAEARRNKKVKEIRAISVDVRHLFDSGPQRPDLTPEREAVAARWRALPRSAEVRVVKLESLALTAEVLRWGITGDAEHTALHLTLDTKRDGIPFVRREVRPEGPDAFSWTGRAREGSGDATLLVTPTGITGTIHSADESYSVRPLGDGLHAIIRGDRRKYSEDEPPSWNPKAETSQDTPPSPGGSPCADVARRIDVVVGYTRGAAKEVRDIEGVVKLAERETNDSYRSSGVDGSVRVVKSVAIGYDDTRSVDKDLAALRDPKHPALGALHRQLEESGADVAVLLTGASDYCGVAGALPAQSASDSFVVVAQDCATGYYSFGHEIGHLMGARHDPCVDPVDTPFAFGHGYVNGKKWRTIMGYGTCCDGCLRIPLWANAGGQYANEATGTPGCCDDHRALNTTLPLVAAFRCPR